MKINLTSTISAKIHLQSFAKLPLKWDLDYLWYGNIHNGFDIENKLANCWGSVPFLYEECGTILFDKQNKTLQAIHINILEPYHIEYEKNITLIKCAEGQIKLIDSEYFTFPNFDSSTYFVKQDILLFLENHRTDNVYQSIHIDEDLFLIIENNLTIGFAIKNASQKINFPENELINKIHLFNYAF